MAGNSYQAWEGGAEFVQNLQANRQQLQDFLAQHSPEEKKQMAEGLAAYLTQAIERDPNDPPMGMSETLDHVREKGGNKIVGALKGIKNDFYNLFDKHPNVMLTTGGIVGLGGGLTLLKHYGLDQGTTGGKITSIGNLLFQSEKGVTLSTGPFRKKLDAIDDSLSGKLADALDGKLPEGGMVPEGMDPDSPEGKMVATSSKAMGKTFEGMVKHREMLISNILVAGETFQTGGFVTNAFLDKKHINDIGPEMHKAEVATARGGMVNAASNTLLMGMTYYSQYIDGKVQGLDKNSPTYKEDLAKVWDEAPKEHMFKPGRICAKLVGALPEKARSAIPNLAIGCSFLPLMGMVKEGMKGNAPLQLYGAIAVMAAVVVNYTAITTGSKAQKVLKPEDVGQLVDVLGEVAKAEKSQNPVIAAEQMDALKQTIMAQSFVDASHEGMVEQKLAAQFGQEFVAVRDHSRFMPTSREPMVLSSQHAVAKAVAKLGAAEADITPEGLSIQFDQAPEATKKAVDTINLLAQNGQSHVAKSLGVLPSQQGEDGRVQLNLPLRALPAVAQAAEALAAQPDLASLTPAQLAETVQEALQIAPQALHLAAQQRSPEAGAQR